MLLLLVVLYDFIVLFVCLYMFLKYTDVLNIFQTFTNLFAYTRGQNYDRFVTNSRTRFDRDQLDHYFD